MEVFLTDPGFAHIADKIVGHLDSKTLVRCRLVSTSFKRIVDNPNFWLQRYKKNSITKIHLVKWQNVCDLLLNSDEKTIEGINVEKMLEDLTMSLMKICLSNHKVESPTHFASMEGNLDLLKLVLKVQLTKKKYWQDLDRIEALGSNVSPIDMAANYGHLEVVKYLKKYTKHTGAAFRDYSDPDADLYDPPSVHYAIENGHVEVAKYFIAENKGERVDMWINRMLQKSALENGQLEVLKLLVDNFGPPNRSMASLPVLLGMILKASELASEASSRERETLFREIAKYLRSLCPPEMIPTLESSPRYC